MQNEIERKYLVKRELWNPGTIKGTVYRQGYLSTDPERVVRVRAAGSAGLITVKGVNRGITRAEFECSIPVAEAIALIDQLCIQPIIEKRRFRMFVGGRDWVIDDFQGANEGLLLAEVELPSADAVVALPDWAGAEVSDDPRYFNSSLVTHPYHSWVTH